MGMSIHYRGRLDDVRRLPTLCDELTDIASTMNWPSATLDDDWFRSPDAKLGGTGSGRIEGHLGLKGVQITPHSGSEPLILFFDKEGDLRSPMTMLLILDGVLKPEEAWISMKTQFSGPDTHVWVVGLLKYLKRRYISNLEVSDESKYWETGNRQELEEKMALINAKLELISTALSSERFGDMTGLSAEEIASKIEQLFQSDDERKNS